VPLDKLRSFIAANGTELLKQKLGAFAADPYHGLPDCTEAREAADGVAEIDALVLAGRPREATGRYRHLTHTTWDQALKVIPRWPDLGRAEKLALFGWHPKDAKQDDKSVPEHPMRDPWLDG
jgi:hypothetical protein